MSDVRDAVFVKHRNGALNEFAGRRAARLRREVLAGRGQAMMLDLVESGYVGFLDDSGQVADFEALQEHYERRYGLNT